MTRAGGPTGIILAAGRGGRAWPLTATRPKPLLPVLGETLLGRLMRQAKSAGLAEVYVVAESQDGPTAQEACRLGAQLGLSIQVRVQAAGGGTGRALQAALDVLAHGPTLVLHADMVLHDGALEDFLAQANGRPSMAIVQTEDVRPFSALALEGDQVKGVREKSSDGPGWTHAGCLLLGAESIPHVERIEASPRGEWELTSALDALARDRGLSAVPIQKWQSVDWPWDLLDAQQLALESLRENDARTVDAGGNLHGFVVVQPGAVVDPGATIEGPAFLAMGSRVRNGAYVRAGTIVGAGATVGHACEIKSSLLFPHSAVNHLSYVGDSIVGENANLGAGTIVANLRHDGRDVRVQTQYGPVGTRRRKFGAVFGDGARTGIHTSINVGVFLPPGHVTMPGEVVLRTPMAVDRRIQSEG